MDPGGDEAGPGRSLYAVLNVSPSASSEEIRRSYRALAQAYHPDKQKAALRAGAAAQFALIQNAHEVGERVRSGKLALLYIQVQRESQTKQTAGPS